MAFYIVAAGGSLYSVNTSGVATTLTLPTGVTLDVTKPARMAVLGRLVCIVNQPSRSLTVDGKNVVRPMVLQPPSGAPVLGTGSGGVYSGTVRAIYTNIIKDAESGALIAESDFSAASASATVSANSVQADGILVSQDPGITARRLYRTVTGPGTAFLPWVDLDGNTLTKIADDMSDAALGLLAAPTELGSAPGMITGSRMTNIVEWKGRLWGVGDTDVDILRYSGNGISYGWPTSGAIPINPVGADSFGITGLMRRRDELGVSKRNIIWKITGDRVLNFTPIKVIEGKGVWGTDTVIIIRDIAYFLGEDGVYTWGPTGVDCISDEKVRGWFATDTYFNRAKFADAFATYNPRYHAYELHLAAAGSSTIDRWVSYDIARREWFGPHLTNAFTPTWSTVFIDVNNFNAPLMGASNGFLYQQNQTAFNDDGNAIPISWVSKSHNADAPDDTKIFQDLSLLMKRQGTAGSLAIGIALGDYDASIAKTFTADLRKTRQRFNNCGPGRNVRLEFTESTLNQGAELHGYEIPWGVLGRR